MKMKNVILMIALVTGVYGQCSAQKSNKIMITVEQINSTKGTIKVAIFNSENDFLEKPFVSKSRQASTGEMEFVFSGLADGEYSVSIYHDENDNGELDTNFMGIPDEPYGISLEGRNMFGPPSYKNAKFTLKDESARLRISLD
jgi:uncharacterized protein (DUF2141 family)